ncbi:concanavalin A-like lectin/glucanase domain-containing protein [Rhizophagus irregularis DAOM 181602=DAOM 197198]|nr:concanavalin A-like lectin/glucanase domain-containing protein [Rhizophagus irregularis DAOM 181602=DAOM 197198]
MLCNIFKFDYYYAIIDYELNDLSDGTNIEYLRKIRLRKWSKPESKLDGVKKNVYIIYQLEKILLLITISFLGIWILMTEIYEIFNTNLLLFYTKVPYEKNLDIFLNIFGTTIIIPISIIFIAIRRRSSSLYLLFCISSVIEVGIIIFRLLSSYRKDYVSYRKLNIDHSYMRDILLNIDNSIIYRMRFFIAIPTLIFLVILNINTYLCYKWIERKFISQIYGSDEDKWILLKRIKMFLKRIFKKFLIFLEIKPEPYDRLKELGVNAWKFVPESRILLLNIVQIKDENDEIENVDKKNEGIVSDENDKDDYDDGTANDENDKDVEIVVENTENNNSNTVVGVENNKNNEFAGVKNYKNVKLNNIIDFKAKSDVMIRTNYPLRNMRSLDLNAQVSPEEYRFLSSQVKYWFYYYEITILSNSNKDKTIIAIGLATKKYPTNRLPGCNTHSVGFHSDEGRIFHNEKYTGSKYSDKWGEVNDVIGCGYVPNTGQVFFTMNGKNLGDAYTGLFYDKWYPTIGSNGFCRLKVNFGKKEFKYKEANDFESGPGFETWILESNVPAYSENWILGGAFKLKILSFGLWMDAAILYYY